LLAVVTSDASRLVALDCKAALNDFHMNRFRTTTRKRPKD
jgi:hypothetical protein